MLTAALMKFELNAPSLFVESSHIFDKLILILNDLTPIQFRHLDQLAGE